MARRTPVAVIDGTDTSGVGSYNLTHPAAANDRQNISDAYTLGILADSDTVAYKVSDDQTSGTSLDYEYGIGTLSSSGQVLSRDTILESSNGGIGGSKVSWTPGGERTVTIVIGNIVVADNNGSEFTSPATFATNLGLPRLGTGNTFTNNNTFRIDSFFLRTNTARAAITVGNEQATAAGELGRVIFQGHDNGGADTEYARVAGEIEDPTNGSEDGRLVLSCMSAGTVTGRLRLASDGTLTAQPSGGKYHAFSSGAKLLWGSTPDTGWTRVNETNRTIIQLARSSDTIGATGGTDDPFDGAWATAGHTLTVSQIPSHTHLVSEITDAVDKNGDGVTVGKGDNIGHDGSNDVLTSATGSGGSHSHNMAIPFFRVACWATKN